MPADRTAPEIPLFSVPGAYFLMLASFMLMQQNMRNGGEPLDPAREISAAGRSVVVVGGMGSLVGALLENVQVVNWKEDKDDPARLLWESIVGALTGLLTNKSEDRLATKIPLSGSFDDPSPDVWVTVANLLRNAFVRAIMPGLDQEIKFQAGR